MNPMNVSTTGIVDDVAVERNFLMRVYAWMAVALLISAAVAYSTAVAPELRTQKRSPATPWKYASPAVAP